MPTATADGAAVHYTTTGTGPPLVLVAGTGLPAAVNYGHLAPAFADRRTVVLPDYAGSGATTEPAGELTVEILAHQIAAVAEAAGDGPVDLVGYSLGAVVAAAVAATHTHLVRRLVLVAGWASSDDPRLQLLMDVWQGLERLDHELFNKFLQLNVFSPGFLSAIGHDGLTQLLAGAPPITEGMRRHMALDRTSDVRELLPKITAPTLVVGLTHDQVISIDHARTLREAIEGSRYAEIESGHGVVFERPDEFVRVIREFLFTDSAY